MRFYEIMNKNSIEKEVEFNEQLIIYAFIITTHITKFDSFTKDRFLFTKQSNMYLSYYLLCQSLIMR